MEEKEDRFAQVAANYDRWVNWEPRLRKEMPFLTATLPAGATLLDVGCGTGAHALALAASGYRVTGLDQSESMLEQARAAAKAAVAQSATVEWVAGDILDPAVLPGRGFDAVLALGNALLSFGDDQKVEEGLRAMVERVNPGGVLILQYLNGTRIRQGGRLVVKAQDPEGTGRPGEIWLRHHFVAGDDLYFHSYVLRPEGSAWTAEVRGDRLVDLTPERILPLLAPRFQAVEFFEGLSGGPFRPLESDAVGVVAKGKR